MVTRLLKHSLLFSIMLSLNACSDDDGIDIIDIKVPEGYALSADISTWRPWSALCGFLLSQLPHDNRKNEALHLGKL